MSHIDIAKRIYLALHATKVNGVIPVQIRPLSTTGTIQDDPFDEWFGNLLKSTLQDCEVIHSGPLTTPDVIIRDLRTGEIVGIEVKKVDQNEKGKDSRGLTLDYNSCIPCGYMQIKIGGRVSKIKTYYFFGLLSFCQSFLVSSCLLDGDFLNYDFDLHLQGKYLNTSQYGHGPYGEGSVRGRAMYLYPNPMNTELSCFYKKDSLIVRDELSYQINDERLHRLATIERIDIHNNKLIYAQYADNPAENEATITDVFARCKTRTRKPRQAYLTELSESPVAYYPKPAQEL